MNEQKFQKEDLVRVRRFDEIDEQDIGRLRKSATECYSINKDFINDKADTIFKIARCEQDIGTYVYKLRDESGSFLPYWWAQGMLDFAFTEELAEPDEEGLFAFLSCE